MKQLRMLAFFGFLFSIFVLDQSALAQCNQMTLEHVMREVQARRIATGLTVISWPSSSGSGAGPAYPQDGYYSSDSAKLAAINSLVTQTWSSTLYGKFHRDTDVVEGFLTLNTMNGTEVAKPGTITAVDSTFANALADACAMVNKMRWQNSTSNGAPYSAFNTALRYRTISRSISTCWGWPEGLTPSGSYCDSSVVGCCGTMPDPICCTPYVEYARTLAYALFAATPQSIGTWSNYGSQILLGGITPHRSEDFGVACTLAQLSCLKPDGSGEYLDPPITRRLAANISERTIEFHLDLSNYCGKLRIYAKVAPGAVGSPVPADDTYHLLAELEGGQFHNMSLGSSDGQSWDMTGIHFVYEGCYTQLIDEQNADPATAIPAVVGPLDGEHAEGNLLERNCPPPIGVAFPVSSSPVSLATGHKVESVTDFEVIVTGDDFRFTREYTSDPSIADPAGGSADGVLLGRGWSTNCFQYLKVSQAGGNLIVQHGGPPLDTYLQFEQVGVNEWSAGGPRTQTLRKECVNIDGVVWPVWRLEEPGAWTKDFIRDPSVAANPSGSSTCTGAITPDSKLIGLLLRESDPYGNADPGGAADRAGNSRYYVYHTNHSAARLHAIFLNGLPSEIAYEAQIVFNWVLDENQSTNGLLRSIEVRRPTQHTSNAFQASGYVVTNQIEFTYAAQPPQGITLHSDVGSERDLVQVTNRELVHDAPEGVSPFWTRITQYRYHDTTSADGAFGTTGRHHQLKAVLMPEQIEYHAQKCNANGAVPVHLALEEAAKTLLASADDSILAWVGGTSLKVRDLAAKIVGYHSSGTSNGRVRYEYLQSTCGCGGGTQGKRQTYDYFAYDLTAPSAADGLTTRITEEIVTDPTQLPPTTTLHRTLYHDMRRYGGVPYEVRRVIQEPAVAGGRSWIWEFEFTGGNLTSEVFPSEFTGYTPTDGFSPPSRTVRSGNLGLVYHHEYNSENRRTRTLVRNSSGGFDTLFETDYRSSPEGFLPSQTRRYRVAGSTLPNDVETVTYAYAFWISGHPGALLWSKTTQEIELTSENGPSNAGTASNSATVETTLLWDKFGRIRYEVAPNGMSTDYAYADSYGSTEQMHPADIPYLVYRGRKNGALTISQVLGVSTSVLPQYASNRWGAIGVGPAIAVNIDWFDRLGRAMVVDNNWGNTGTNTKQHTNLMLAENPARPGILYLQSRTQGAVSVSGSGSNFVLDVDGPIHVRWLNAANNEIRSADVAVASEANGQLFVKANLAPRLPADALPDQHAVSSLSTGEHELTRTIVDHDLSGLVTAVHRWASIDDNIVETTSNQYDALGRLTDTIMPSGTVDRVAVRDVLDRVLRKDVGTTPNGTFSTVLEQYFDDENDANGPSQGIGNGNLTWSISYTGESGAAGLRTSRRRFDHRDRLVATIADDQPIEALGYDHLSRVISRAVFEADWSSGTPSVPASPEDASALSRRSVYEQTLYSQRGLPYRSQVAVDPTSPSSDWLVTDRWFDRKGRVVALAVPGAPVVKTVYDGIDRTLKVYVTAERPAANYQEAVVSADDPDINQVGTNKGANLVEQDRVLEQTNYIYDSSGAYQSLLRAVVHRKRRHSAPDTELGALEPPFSGPTNFVDVVQYTGYLYDSFERLTATIDFGGNAAASETDLTAGAALPTAPPLYYSTDKLGFFLGNGASSAYDNKLYTRYRYNERGLVDQVLVLQGPTPTVTTDDGVNHVTRTFFDDLNRPILVIDGYDESKLTSPTDVFNTRYSWQTTSGIRWPSPNYTFTADASSNNATATIYDAAGRMQAMVGINRRLNAQSNWETQPQFTEYVYGTTIGSASNVLDTLINHNDLLAEVRYPNPANGLPGTVGPDKVVFAYNSLGEIRGTRDQNGTVHQFVRDRAGRSIVDRVTQFGSAVADQTTTSIESLYDQAGRLSLVRSFAGTNVRNAVGFSYTPQWQIAQVQQDIDSDLGGAGLPTRSVQYQYDTQEITGGNYTRLQKLVYPDGSPLDTDYSTGGTISAAISRPKSLKMDVDQTVTGLETIVNYTYLGVGTPVVIDYADIDVQLDRTAGADGKRLARGFTDQQQARYPGLDPYSRNKAQRWMLGPTTQDPATLVPNRRWLSGDAYAYDASSKMTSRSNLDPQASLSTDWQYTYDQADRLTESLRGRAAATFTPAAAGSLQWSLDSLGNWQTQTLDGNGDGLFNDPLDVVSPRSYNASNERIDQTPSPYIYDDNGNLITKPLSAALTQKYIYDGWNRLTEVRRIDSQSQEFIIAQYRYNGLHWRIEKISDVRNPPIAPTQLTQRREMYYSAEWQLLHEDIDDDYSIADPGSSTIDRHAQQVWGLRNVDDAVLRREDRYIPEVPEIPPDPETGYPGSPAVPAVPLDGVYDYTWYYMTDHQWSVIGILDDTGRLLNRVTYDSYGNSLYHAPADVDLSGVIEQADVTAQQNLWSASFGVPGHLEGDFDMNGLVDVADTSAFLDNWFAESGQPIYRNQVSKTVGLGVIGPGPTIPDSVVGYCGYLVNPETGDYCIRHRVYDTVEARWLQRDPLGYHDGMNLYEYVGSSPMMASDPMGLWFEGTATRLAQSNSLFGRATGRLLGIVGGAAEGVTTGIKTEAVGAFKLVRETGYTISDGIGFGREAVTTKFGLPTVKWNPVSQLGKRAQYGGSIREIAVDSANNVFDALEMVATFGTKSLAEGAVEWAKTGDPTAFQESAGGNAMFAFAARQAAKIQGSTSEFSTATKNACDPKVAGPAGHNAAMYNAYKSQLLAEEAASQLPLRNISVNKADFTGHSPGRSYYWRQKTAQSKPELSTIIADEYGRMIFRTDWTSHGRMDHLNPHWHSYDWTKNPRSNYPSESSPKNGYPGSSPQ